MLEGRPRGRSDGGICREGDTHFGGPLVDVAHIPQITNGFPLVVPFFSPPRYVIWPPL